VDDKLLLDEAAGLADEITALRHALHREPEIGLDLPRTQQKVLDALAGLPLQITRGRRTTSVTAVLRGAGGRVPGAPAPVVLLRGDMDALPVHEAGDSPFRSQIDGAMHACGHDLHTAMLAGAARLLCQHRDELAGDVVFMFQPGEESWDGAGIMIDEGVLEAAGSPVSAVLALHVFSGLVKHGEFFTRPGTMMAASDQLHVTVFGEGGHGSAPHLALDPVPAIAEMVLALQTMVTRRFDVTDPVVLTVGLMEAGTKATVIPPTGRFQATIRTFSERTRERVMDLSVRLVRAIAEGQGMDAEVNYVPGYPVTVNDESETTMTVAIIDGLFGPGRRAGMPHPLATAEDFSRVLNRVPGTFVGLGAAPAGADPATVPFNHSPAATFDDGVLADGAALYAGWAIRRLAQEAAARSGAGDGEG
jgi:amidohydrolase